MMNEESLRPHGNSSFFILRFSFFIPANQFQQFLYRLLFGDILLDTFFFLIKADFASSGTYIAIVGVRHFTRTVYDAAHDAYLQAFQVRGRGLDAGDGCFEVVERTSASRAGDVFGFRSTQASGLQDAECSFV